MFAGVDGPEFALSLPSLNESTTGVYVKSDYAQEWLFFSSLNRTQKTYFLYMIQPMVLVWKNKRTKLKNISKNMVQRYTALKFIKQMRFNKKLLHHYRT